MGAAEFAQSQKFVVTGASSGIGKGVALLLNALGASVIAIARDERRLLGMREEAVRPDCVYVEKVDLTADINGLPDFMKTLKGKYGKLHGMALCAGVSSVMPVRALDYAEMLSVLNINYFVPIMMAKAFCDKRINDGPGSAIVAISSIAALHQASGMAAYAGSKAALIASLNSVAKESANNRVRINCISPAMVSTPMSQGTDDLTDVSQHKYPFGFAEVDDVANLVAFLLSDKAKWISGQNYVMDCASF